MKLVYHPEVKPFIDSLQRPARAKVASAISRLKDYGPDLGMPLSKQIEQNLFELRTKGKQEVRLFYGVINKSCYIVHVFVKKTQRTPRKEINKAKKRLSL